MSGGFFRGTSADQDTRFSNKQAKLLKSQKFAPELEHLVDMTKVKMEVMKPWIARRVTELLGFEDEVLINFIYTLLEGKVVNGKEVQIQLTGFMEKNTGKFMKELWTLLLSAQQTTSGVPQPLLDAKAEELLKKEAYDNRIISNIEKKKEDETMELQSERSKKMDEVKTTNFDVELGFNKPQRKDAGGRNSEDRTNDLRNGSRRKSRISSSPESTGRLRDPSRGMTSRRRRSYSRSRSTSGRNSRSVSASPRRRSFSPDRPSYHSSRRLANSPPARRSKRTSASPVRRTYSRRRSSLSGSRSPSPGSRRMRRSPSPRRRLRSPSPIRRRRSPSPARFQRIAYKNQRTSSSPTRRGRSPSPTWRRRSPSPGRHRRRRTPSPSPSWRRGSPRRRRSRSSGRHGRPASPSRRRRHVSPSPSPVDGRIKRRSPENSDSSSSARERRSLSPRRRSPARPRDLKEEREKHVPSPQQPKSPLPPRRSLSRDHSPDSSGRRPENGGSLTPQRTREVNARNVSPEASEEADVAEGKHAKHGDEGHHVGNSLASDMPKAPPVEPDDSERPPETDASKLAASPADHRHKSEHKSRKHKRSRRREVDSDDAESSDSESEGKRESKKRRKEEKRMRKVERRRRREERRRRREERRGEKAKGRDRSSDSSSDDGGEEEKEVSREEEKRLEYELRKKALESYKAKKGMKQ